MSRVKCPLYSKNEIKCTVKQKGDALWKQHGKEDYLTNYCSSIYYLDCIDFRDYIKNISVKKGKILIVDDEKDFVRILKRFFADLGYSVLSATNGNIAMKFVANEEPVMLLLDMNLPSVNGIEILKFVKQHYSSTKVIVITGYKEEYIKQLTEFNVDAVFDKPVRLEALKKYIEELLAEDVLGKTVLNVETEDYKQPARANILFFVKEDKDKLKDVRKNFLYESLKRELESKKTFGDEYFLEKAFSEKELFEKLENFKPDIVLVDYEDTQNFDFASIILKLRESRFRPHEIITIGFRGYLLGEDLARTQNNCADKCLRSISKLFDQIRLVAYQYKLTKD